MTGQRCFTVRNHCLGGFLRNVGPFSTVCCLESFPGCVPAEGQLAGLTADWASLRTDEDSLYLSSCVARPLMTHLAGWQAYLIVLLFSLSVSTYAGGTPA